MSKHICMLVTSDLDRDPRVQKEAQSASLAGYKVTVICRSSTLTAAPYQIIPVNVGYQNVRIAKYVERIATMLKMLWIVVKLRPNLIHANDLDTLPIGAIASKISKAKLVYDAHELWAHAGRDVGSIGKNVATRLERRLVHAADVTVTVSESLAEFIANEYSIPKPTVVMNAAPFVDVSNKTPESWRHQFAGKQVALFHGRYVEGRGLEEMVLAANYLPKHIVMVMRGYGPLEENLKQLVLDHKLSEQVVFIPPVDMFDLVSKAVGADVGIFPSDPALMSKLFAAPNKIFEYMMAGVPCVGADTPDVRRILLGYNVGCVFHAKSPTHLAEVIIDMLKDEEQLLRMKTNAFAHAKNFAWEGEAQKLLQQYARLLQ